MPLDLRGRLRTLLTDIASGDISLATDYLRLADPSDAPSPRLPRHATTTVDNCPDGAPGAHRWRKDDRR